MSVVTQQTIGTIYFPRLGSAAAGLPLEKNRSLRGAGSEPRGGLVRLQPLPPAK